VSGDGGLAGAAGAGWRESFRFFRDDVVTASCLGSSGSVGGVKVQEERPVEEGRLH